MSAQDSRIKNWEGVNVCEESVQVDTLKGDKSCNKVSGGEPSDGSCCS